MTGQSWSAHALNERVLHWAEQLQAHRAGERIAFRLPNSPDWLALFLALQRSGLAAMPLDGGLPGEACFETARRFGAIALFLDGKFHSLGATQKRFRSCCCLKMTSGSSGLPKAVECRAEHLIADGEQIIRTMGIRSADRNLAAIPLSHSYGLGNLVMPLILQGTPLVTVAGYVPRQLVEWIGKYRVTVFPGVPRRFFAFWPICPRG